MRIDLDGGDSVAVMTYPPRADVWVVWKLRPGSGRPVPQAYPITAAEARVFATALNQAADTVEAKSDGK